MNKTLRLQGPNCGLFFRSSSIKLWIGEIQVALDVELNGRMTDMQNSGDISFGVWYHADQRRCHIERDTRLRIIDHTGLAAYQVIG